MSSVEMRRQLQAEIRALPPEKLGSVLDFTRYVAHVKEPPFVSDAEARWLNSPAIVKRIKAAQRSIAAGNTVSLDQLKRKIGRRN